METRACVCVRACVYCSVYVLVIHTACLSARLVWPLASPHCCREGR